MNMTRKQRDIVDYVKLGSLAIALTVIIFYIIIPLINRTNRNGFADEVAKYVKVVDDNYISDYIIGSSESGNDSCIDIHEIIHSDSKNYKGVVVIKTNSSNVEGAEKYVYVSNGKYVYNSDQPYSHVDKDGILDAKYAKPRYKNCENFEKGKIY